MLSMCLPCWEQALGKGSGGAAGEGSIVPQVDDAARARPCGAELVRQEATGVAFAETVGEARDGDDAVVPMRVAAHKAGRKVDGPGDGILDAVDADSVSARRVKVAEWPGGMNGCVEGAP